VLRTSGRGWAKPTLEGAGEPRVELAVAPAIVIGGGEIIGGVLGAILGLAGGAALTHDEPELPEESEPEEDNSPEPVPTPPEPPKRPDPEVIAEIAKRIAHGHAYKKHVERNNEFSDIISRENFQSRIEFIMNHPDDFKELERGRVAYWGQIQEIIIIHDPNHSDLGTAYKARDGKESFNRLQ